MRLSCPIVCILVFIILSVEIAAAQMPTSVKHSTIRSESPHAGKETLILPYAFSSETMGLTFGVGGMMKGYGQEQLSFAATIYAGTNNDLEQKDDAIGILGAMWDWRLPYTNRFYLTATASAGYYPLKRAYSAPAFDPSGPRPGSNNSRADQFIEVGGSDNWLDIRLEYVLPIGAAENQAMMTYKLKNGMLASEPTGGGRWDPFSTGVTNVLLRTYNRYQEYEFDPGSLQRTIHPLQLALSYDNTDFPTNPSCGSRQFIGVTHDFAMLESNQTWTFWELEASKFFSLGDTDRARQRVLAFNGWTGNTPSWEETTLDNGLIKVNHAPPYYEGATLGGFYRLRAYPFSRFNDRSVIYSTAEYRYTPKWNPIAEIPWLRFLKLDFLQVVGFVEGGRVARAYTLSELASDWKSDIGTGVRALVAGSVIRLDAAVSKEGASFWFMVGHPF